MGTSFLAAGPTIRIAGLPSRSSTLMMTRAISLPSLTAVSFQLPARGVAAGAAELTAAKLRAAASRAEQPFHELRMTISLNGGTEFPSKYRRLCEPCPSVFCKRPSPEDNGFGARKPLTEDVLPAPFG